jgi:hypothetical protein
MHTQERGWMHIKHQKLRERIQRQHDLQNLSNKLMDDDMSFVNEIDFDKFMRDSEDQDLEQHNFFEVLRSDDPAK